MFNYKKKDFRKHRFEANISPVNVKDFYLLLL